MEGPSKCTVRIEKLVTHFLKELRQGRLSPLLIPNLTSEGDLEDIMETEEALWAPGDMGIARRIEAPQSSRSYAQLMAIIAIVAELQARKTSRFR
jgi:DNA topoisomerase VI subunit A